MSTNDDSFPPVKADILDNKHDAIVGLDIVIGQDVLVPKDEPIDSEVKYATIRSLFADIDIHSHYLVKILHDIARAVIENNFLRQYSDIVIIPEVEEKMNRFRINMMEADDTDNTNLIEADEIEADTIVDNDDDDMAIKTVGSNGSETQSIPMDDVIDRLNTIMIECTLAEEELSRVTIENETLSNYLQQRA